MSRTEVLQKIGFPGAYTTNAAQGTAFETWLVGELPGHSAELDISYASDGRVRSIERHRYHTRRPNNPGAAY